MQPKSIRQFELAYWLWLVLNLVSIAVSWPALQADPNMATVSAQAPWFPYAVAALLTGLFAWLGVAIARRGSNIGKWIFVTIAVLSALSLARGLSADGFTGDANGWLGLATALLAVIAAVLLFRPDAKAWFAGTSAAVVG